MHYYDDLLNVFAYLRSLEMDNAEMTKVLLGRMDILEQKQKELGGKMDTDIEYLKQVAEQLGIDVSDLKLERPEPAAQEETPSVQTEKQDLIKIHISSDYDFSAHFAQLVERAHEAGFTDAHPEDKLSEEEMQRAIESSELLDKVFEQETKLRGKDMIVMVIAVAVRVLIFYLGRYLHDRRMQKLESVDPNVSRTPSLLNQSGAADNPAGGIPGIVDATGGIDINSVIEKARKLSSNIPSSGGVLEAVTGFAAGRTHVRGSDSIIGEPLPFEYFENHSRFTSEMGTINKSDLAGYNKYMGWVLGVFNIMTDTLTTMKFKSFAVERAVGLAPEINIDNEVSTFNDIVLPVITSAAYQKESVIAAVMQEASLLDYAKLTPSDATKLLKRAVETERTNRNIGERATGVISRFSEDLVTNAGNFLNNAFVNTLVYAIHGIMYRPEKDGNFDHYTIRTNKIICYSNGLAAVANSIEGLITENYTKLDYAGMAMFLITLFQSRKFWIDTKAAYLASEYRKPLEDMLHDLDEKYFVYDDEEPAAEESAT